MGSKARIAKHIAPILNQCIKDNNIKNYIEPFVGGSNMIEKIECENLYGYDNNEYLISFWQELQNGWNPLENINMTKELYNNIKDNKDQYHKSIVALAGFCATYNAKWFGGYAGIVTTKINTKRNYYDEAVRNVLNQVESIKSVKYVCLDYKSIKNPKDAVIYCDPPYANSTKYKDDFDHTRFWNWIRNISHDNYVLVSEYVAPDDFISIWDIELTTTLDKSSRSKSVEKLFTYKNGLYDRYNTTSLNESTC